MFSRISKGLVLALSLTASTVAVGCAGNAEENIGSDEGAATSSTLSHDYEGTIGNNKVFVRIDRVGAAITGSYFYDKPGTSDDVLVLKGSLAGTKLTMTESVNAAGADTGAFNGNVSGDSITGTWKAGNTTLPLKLTAIKSLKTVQHKYVANIKAAKVPGQEWQPRDCSLDADGVEIFGLDPAAEKAMMDALKIERLDRDQEGHCDSDIRYVSQTVELNDKGFLTIHVATEYDGGAHPENASEYYNFQVTTGQNIGPNEIFQAGSEAKVKELMIKAMQKQQTPDFTAEDIKAQIEEFEQHFDAETKLENIQMGVLADGLHIDMGNNYPHVILALAPAVTIPWSDVKPLMTSWSAAQVMAK